MMRPFRGRLALAWASVRDSLWFIPGLAACSGGVLAVAAVQLPPPQVDSRLATLILFGGGVEGARGVLATIAGSLITVTGVIFSVTVVALQLASSQFTPRVLRGLVADRANQTVLGVFIGTFTYTLLVLRSIRSATDDGDSFVPQVAVAIAVGLLLVSVGALIFFIDHAARSVQASVILDRETRGTLRRIARLLPDAADLPPLAPLESRDALPGGGQRIGAVSSGYVQAIAIDALCELALASDLTIRVEVATGDFVIPGTALFTVWATTPLDDAAVKAASGSVVLGPERTPEQDIEAGVVTIVDMGLRSLSPGINDPTTAMLCIDRLTEVLAAVAARPAERARRYDGAGTLRLVVRTLPFSRLLELAFGQLRHFGASNPTVAAHLLRSLGRLDALVPPDLRPPVRRQAEAVIADARRRVEGEVDIGAVEAAGSWCAPSGPAAPA